MSLNEKQQKRVEILKASGVKILDELPEGWRYMGVFLGEYQWANNGKSRFGPGYDHALVKHSDGTT